MRENHNTALTEQLSVPSVLFLLVDNRTFRHSGSAEIGVHTITAYFVVASSSKGNHTKNKISEEKKDNYGIIMQLSSLSFLRYT